MVDVDIYKIITSQRQNKMSEVTIFSFNESRKDNMSSQ